MAYTEHEMTVSLKAARDLTNFLYCGMKVSAAETCDVCSQNIDQSFIGVLKNQPGAANRMATVVWAGITKVRAAGSITAGDLLTCQASGMFTASNSGLLVVGQALQTAAAANDIITARIFPFFNGNVS